MTWQFSRSLDKGKLCTFLTIELELFPSLLPKELKCRSQLHDAAKPDPELNCTFPDPPLPQSAPCPAPVLFAGTPGGLGNGCCPVSVAVRRGLCPTGKGGIYTTGVGNSDRTDVTFFFFFGWEVEVEVEGWEGPTLLVWNLEQVSFFLSFFNSRFHCLPFPSLSTGPRDLLTLPTAFLDHPSFCFDGLASILAIPGSRDFH